MFEEESRTYRTALEEGLKWNINFLKGIVLILLVSSCSLLLYLIMYSIYFRIPGLYFGDIYIVNRRIRFFFNIFSILASYTLYPLNFILAIIIMKKSRYFPKESKRKLLTAGITLLSIQGVVLILGIIRAFFLLYGEFIFFYVRYQRMIDEFTMIYFISQILVIALALYLLSKTIYNQKESGGYAGNRFISPYILLSITVGWSLLVIIYRIIYYDYYYVGLGIPIAVISCLISATLIATCVELLMKLRKINIPQIITTKEKLA